MLQDSTVSRKGTSYLRPHPILVDSTSYIFVSLFVIHIFTSEQGNHTLAFFILIFYTSCVLVTVL